MAGLINLRLLTDFFNKIGQQRKLLVSLNDCAMGPNTSSSNNMLLNQAVTTWPGVLSAR
jgi:hypothetical protein